MNSIHISDIRSFRQCRRKWDWSSRLRRNLEPTVPYAPFFTGRAIHACLEYYYQDGTPLSESVYRYLAVEEENLKTIGALWPAEEKTFEEQIYLIHSLLDHYALWVEQDTRKYSDKNLEYLKLEVPFDIPMPMPSGNMSTAMRLAGRFDGLVRHRETGELWIWEAKTTRSIGSLVGSLVNDEQCRLYAYAASLIFDEPVVGVLYNMLKKTPPTRPKPLKNGGLSKNKSINTTAFFYKRAIQEEYPDWSDDTIDDYYGDILMELQDKEDLFFLRYPLYVHEYEIKLMLEGIYHTACEMLDRNIKTYPSPGWLNCNFCHFKAPCLAMNAGGNYEVLLAEEYQDRVAQVSMRQAAEEKAEAQSGPIRR